MGCKEKRDSGSKKRRDRTLAQMNKAYGGGNDTIEVRGKGIKVGPAEWMYWEHRRQGLLEELNLTPCEKKLIVASLRKKGVYQPKRKTSKKRAIKRTTVFGIEM